MTQSATYTLTLDSTIPANGWQLINVEEVEKSGNKHFILGKYAFYGANSKTFRRFRSPIVALSLIEISYRVWYFGSLNQVTDAVHLEVNDEVCDNVNKISGMCFLWVLIQKIDSNNVTRISNDCSDTEQSCSQFYFAEVSLPHDKEFNLGFVAETSRSVSELKWGVNDIKIEGE